jgi:hypothetical protein
MKTMAALAICRNQHRRTAIHASHAVLLHIVSRRVGVQ